MDGEGSAMGEPAMNRGDPEPGSFCSLVVICHEKGFSSASISRKLNRGFKQISPGVFYGSPLGAPAKNPHQLLRLLNDTDDLSKRTELIIRYFTFRRCWTVVDLIGACINVFTYLEHQRFSQFSLLHMVPLLTYTAYKRGVWLTFPRQDDAIKFADSHEDVSVFSYQDHLSGQRRFLVSSYEEFWQRYSSMDSKFRHHYEVIQGGLPCHLYFDLEFNTQVNREHNGVHMVDLLTSFIFEVIHDTYGIYCKHDWVVELDSSTQEKFSRHLIIRIPYVAFKDNSHVGAFVAEVCSRITCERLKDPRFNQLYVAKDANSSESSTQIFLDKSVYSRNRCFRLPFSSKAGKQSVLLPTGRFKCNNLSKQQIFMESLICRMDVNCKELLTFNLEANSNREPVSYISQELMACRFTTDIPKEHFSGKSPFLSLDRFIESMVSNSSIREVPCFQSNIHLAGWIRSWYWFSDYDLMVYNIAGNRFCERIGRQHKSNHVMYVVDFRRSCYYQKCHDPECRGYRSPMHPLPYDVIPCSLSSFNTIQGNIKKETANINFNLQLSETDEKPFSSIPNTDSIKRDSAWWKEVIQKVDDVEGLRRILDFTELDLGRFAENS
ncbi:DNA-directed primase/polymerase protein [Nymphaea thermarum]|nr:DNA-directed primase/polymerase protein [Nymphaea thermarum]